MYSGQKKCIAKALQVLAEAGITKPPVDLDTLAAHLDVEIVYEQFEGEGLCGLLYREPGKKNTPEKKIIGVNRGHRKTRQRFTIAHEFGHLLLHRGHPVFMDRWVLVDLREERRGEGNAAQEREANWFAAELLMPEEWVETALRAMNSRRSLGDEGRLIRELAKEFNVSLQSMEYRLMNLGFLSPSP